METLDSPAAVPGGQSRQETEPPEGSQMHLADISPAPTSREEVPERPAPLEVPTLSDPLPVPVRSSQTYKEVPSKTLPPHSKTAPINILPVSQSLPQDTLAPPNQGAQNETPLFEGALSSASLERKRPARRDAGSHSPSPSRRRPPLSPSSSLGGSTPPRSRGLPSPKPLYNPYAKSPYRVTGFKPGSPKAPVVMAKLSAETESELLEATERGLFSDDDDVAPSSRGSQGLREGLIEGGGAADLTKETRKEDLEEREVACPERAVMGLESTADESETSDQQTRSLMLGRREGDEYQRSAAGGAAAGSKSVEVREHSNPPQDRGVLPEAKPRQRSVIDGSLAEALQGSSASIHESGLTALEPESTESILEGANIPLGPPSPLPSQISPDPQSDKMLRLPSSEGEQKRSARSRWHRANLQVAAVRAFGYSNVGSFSEGPVGETGGLGERSMQGTQGSIPAEGAPNSGPVPPSVPIAPPAAGTSSADVPKARGRRRFVGIVVKEEHPWSAAISNVYIETLKAPLTKFLLSILLLPALLCLIFVPLYLLDSQGLQCEYCDPPLPQISTPVYKAPDCLCHVVLYSLSVSLMFSGSPVQPSSRYTLLIANLQSLMAQFTFVFLSGAVFSRMTQRSQPVRCARKAVIRKDDVTEGDGDGSEQYRVFLTRLVLKGPQPCVLVDVKIKLTFRIFVQQENGSLFCSTAELELLRPEVSYLQYGIMVKHVIDRSSPLYGHTKESLLAGDASFLFTITGTERASLQSMFHMQEYYFSDGDLVWDGDYRNMLTVNSKGLRVIDHSQLDAISVFRSAASVPRVISRLQSLVRLTKFKAKNLESLTSKPGVDTTDGAAKPVEGQTALGSSSLHNRDEGTPEFNTDQEEAGKGGTSLEMDENAVQDGESTQRQNGSGGSDSSKKEGGGRDTVRRWRSASLGEGFASREELVNLRRRRINKAGGDGSSPERQGEKSGGKGPRSPVHTYNAGF